MTSFSWTTIAIVVAGYGVGSLPFGLWFPMATHRVDVREHGSGNMGATNVLRTVGPRVAIMTFVFDVAKGCAPVVAAAALHAGMMAAALGGIAAVVGHSWPCFAHFRGGKGVATAFGALLLLAPGCAGVGVAVGLVNLGLTRIVSLSALVTLCTATLAIGWTVLHGGDSAILIYAIVSTLIVMYRHRANLERLSRGAEPRLGR